MQRNSTIISSDLCGKKFSSAVGWLTSLKMEIGYKNLQEDLQFSRSVMEPNVCGYCICLYFLEKISTHYNNFDHILLR